MNQERLESATYILPIRQAQATNDTEFTKYLGWLSSLVQVIVVDGSPEEIFDQHAAAWTGITHLKPSPAIQATNGKVQGVLTGLSHSKGAKLIIADDDVRYDLPTLRGGLSLLDDFDIVRPQNFFSPMPWHARWDSARSLFNRISGGDWPGTLLVRRAALESTGGYDGDCLFENLELVRTVRAAGGKELVASDLFVRRLPPTTRHFLGQRVRQAYDEFARPWRMACQLALLPLLMAASRKPLLLAAFTVLTILLSEAGRQRAKGEAVFPPSTVLFAPLWVAERAICSWLAVLLRVTHGGMPYAGRVIGKAASSPESIQRKILMSSAPPVSS